MSYKNIWIKKEEIVKLYNEVKADVIKNSVSKDGLLRLTDEFIIKKLCENYKDCGE